MDALLSRQAVKNKKVYSEERHEYVVPVAEIDWLPSAQPKRKSGRWIDMNDYDEIFGRVYQCTACKNEMVGKWKYCPYCGEKKRGYKREYAYPYNMIVAAFPEREKDGGILDAEEDRIAKVFQTMDAKSRVAVIRYYKDGMSLRRIAQDQNVSQSTISSRKRKALLWLRRYEKYIFYEEDSHVDVGESL